MTSAAVTNLLCPDPKSDWNIRLKNGWIFTYRNPVAPSFSITSSRLVQDQENDLMLSCRRNSVLEEQMASGEEALQWDPFSFSHVKTEIPLNTFARCRVQVQKNKHVALLMFRVPKPSCAPIGKHLANSSQSVSLLFSGKLLPIYLASSETIFPRRGALIPVPEGGKIIMSFFSVYPSLPESSCYIFRAEELSREGLDAFPASTL